MSISDKKAKQSICDHYNCDYEDKKVLKCRYCGRYFCEEHIHPNKTSIDGFSNHNDFKVAQGHGCSGYATYIDNEKKIQFEKENDTLNILTGKVPKLSEKTKFVSYEDIIKEKISNDRIRHKRQIHNLKTKRSKKFNKNKTHYLQVNRKYRKESIQNLKENYNFFNFNKTKYFLKSIKNKHSKNLNLLILNIFYLIIVFILLNIIYDNLSYFNKYSFSFIRIGSILLLICVYFMLKYLYSAFKVLKKINFHLSEKYKLIFILFIIIFLFNIYNNPNIIINPIQKINDSIEFNNFYPFINSENTQTPNISHTTFDLRKINNLLPQPWGVIIFWGTIIIISLSLLSKYLFSGNLPEWLIWILIIIGIILLFQLKIPYNDVELKSSDAYCDDNNHFNIPNNFFGVSEMIIASNCIEYASSQCRYKCFDNTPFCQCEANLVDLIFHQKGDWILGL